MTCQAIAVGSAKLFSGHWKLNYYSEKHLATEGGAIEKLCYLADAARGALNFRLPCLPCLKFWMKYLIRFLVGNGGGWITGRTTTVGSARSGSSSWKYRSSPSPPSYRILYAQSLFRSLTWPRKKLFFFLSLLNNFYNCYLTGTLNWLSWAERTWL